MTRPDLTLTGAIEGLLLRGSPVRHASTGDGEPDIVTHHPNGTHCMTAFLGLVDQRAVALDLTDPLGLATALHWLKERGHDIAWASRRPDVVAWSVMAVSRGSTPIRDVLDRWGRVDRPAPGQRRRWVRRVYGRPENPPLRVVDDVGWLCFPGWDGPETGDLGRAKADAAALAANYALLQPDGAIELPQLPEVTCGD